MKGRKFADDDDVTHLHGKLLAGRARSTILPQQNPSFVEMLDQVHFIVSGVYLEK